MTRHLTFGPTPDGLIVRMDGDPPVPVREWTSLSEGSVGVGTLIRLRDDGAAVEQDDGCSLSIPWRSVAGLTSDELRFIGLPDASPFVIEVIANRAIHDADFQIRYGFLRNGQRVLGARREGAWLYAGGDEFVLFDPVYSIADAIDRFDRVDEADLESRMLRWGRIAEMLPEDAVVGDDNLRSLRIVVASSFELDPFVNEDGEPDFDPVVGRRATRVSEAGDEDHFFDREALPAARQRTFARRFRALSGVKRRYAVEGGFYVVLTPEVERALTVVRRAQSGTPDQRRDFLRNPSGYLRGTFDTDEFELDSVFSDDGLSERVSGVGIWVGKVLPWIRQAAEPWMPPEASGLRIGSRIVQLPPEDLPDLLKRLRNAVERGDATVHTVDGIEIPADSATVSAVEALCRRLQPVQNPTPSRERHPPRCGPDDGDQVLIVIDNLETLQFKREPNPREHRITAEPALRTELLPHQRECLAWLESRWNSGSVGALLADDMGLGKTLEALAFLSCLKTHSLPMLIVAPTGLLKNWMDEHEKHLSEGGLGPAVEAHGGRSAASPKETCSPSRRRTRRWTTATRHCETEGCSLGDDHVRNASRLSAQLRPRSLACGCF